MSNSAAPEVRPTVVVVAHGIDRLGQGMERLHAELILRLSDRYQFIVVAGSIDPVTAERATFIKVTIPSRPIPLRFAWFYLAGSRAVRALGAETGIVHSCGAIVAQRCDVVSVHLCQAAVIAANGGRLAPRGATGLRRMNTALLKCMALWSERRALRPPTVCAAVSARCAAEVSAAYDVDVVVTQNAVDPAHFDARGIDRGAVRGELGLDPAAPVVLMVGGDWSLRGVTIVVDAIAGLEGVVLVVAGRGDATSIERHATERGCADRVVLLGPRHDLAALYAMADVFVVASAYETFSLVLVEAALVGTPIVTTDVGIAPELIGADGGWMVERTSVAVRDGIASVLGNPTEARHRSEVASQRAQQYSYDRLVEEVDRLYHQVGGRR